MRFVDQVRIEVKAGDGGHGAVAFRREKYVERGGPSGGDGGSGGSVVFQANPQLTTLLDYRYQQHHRAKNGQHGMGSDCNGASMEDLLLEVPVGTLIRDDASGEILCDLSEPGQRFVAAKGGRGGLGNMNFATSTRQTPRFAQDGTPGEERTLLLELKLLADVGLLGYPNAGKSTLISVVSRARPKIADYPFTTLVPNLGIVGYKDDRSFVMADIPGLIEGASEGAGLGHQFLRHVERCRVLLHLVDLSAEGPGRDPLLDWFVINRELKRYSPELSQKPQLLVATKLDLPEARARYAAFRGAMAKHGLQVHALSAVTSEGVQALLDATAEVLWGRASQRALGHVKALAALERQKRPPRLFPEPESPEQREARELKELEGLIAAEERRKARATQRKAAPKRGARRPASPSSRKGKRAPGPKKKGSR